MLLPSNSFLLFLVLLSLYLVVPTPRAFAAVAAAAAVPQSQSRPPIFRAPSARELADADSAGAPIAWSAHQTEDALVVISNASQRISLACLLDAGGGASGNHLELSWSVEANANLGHATMRHTLNGATAERQTFSLDLGSGLKPATGDFRSGVGSLLVLAFPDAAPKPLSISCDLRLVGSASVRSARFRIWDERPLIGALTESTATKLPCKRTQYAQQESNFTAVTLECDGPLTAEQNAALILGTAVYCLDVSQPGRQCTDPRLPSTPRLQSNLSDPSSFYAFYSGGRLRVGWTLEGRGAALQALIDSHTPATESALCITADVAAPSGLHRQTLVWSVRITSSSDVQWNSSSTISASYGTVFIATGIGGEVSLNRFEEPPIPRALPCPYLCPSAAVPPCSFAWLHAPSGAASATFVPLDASLDLLVRRKPHSLLLLPWKPPGNPGPPPLSGVWTCRHVGSLPTVSSPEFRVKVVPQPSLCGRRMPSRSVMFLDGEINWFARQSLLITCNVCGVDSTVETELSLLATVGDVEVTAEQSSTRLAGGGVELGLSFTAFRKGAGSVVLRCRAIDRLGRGAVAYSTVEALPSPPNRVELATDCGEAAGNIGVECRRFRCPLDPVLAAAVRDLPLLLSVAFLFTLQPDGAAPPQQVLVTVDYLVLSDLQFSRLSCTQLVYYSSDEASGETSRRQLFLASNAAAAAALRAALGDSRYSRLLLVVESDWMTIEGAVRPDAPHKALRQSKYEPNNYRPPNAKKGDDGLFGDPVDVAVGIILAISISVALFFIITQYREKLKQICCQCLKAPTPPGPATPTAQDLTTGSTRTPSTVDDGEPEKKAKKKKKPDADDESDTEGKKKKGTKRPKSKKKKKDKDGDESLTGVSEEFSVSTPMKGDDEFGSIVVHRVIKGDTECSDVELGKTGCVDQLSLPRGDFTDEWSFSASNNVEVADQPPVRLSQVIQLSLLSSSSNFYVLKSPAALPPATLPWESPSSSEATSTASSGAVTQMECALRERKDLPASEVQLPKNLFVALDESELRLLLPNAVGILLEDQVQMDSVCESRAAELTRIQHCLNCRPPRYRVGTAVSGVELSAVSSSPSSSVSSPHASPKMAITVLDVAGQSAEELDMPSSEDINVVTMSGSAVIISSEDSNQEQPAAIQEAEVEDLGITGSGCCSEDSPIEKRPADPIRGLTIYEEEDEVAQFDRMVREAVRTAVEKTLTFD